uniref:Protein kinase domain-containing protein n=1 Tax=Macrostomum lignano TaxID=282301 RepID=A0A1I8FAT1_9PLAT
CTAFRPLLAKLLLGQFGQAISRRANRFPCCRVSQPPLHRHLAAAGSGSYTGRHCTAVPSVPPVPVAYSFEIVELTVRTDWRLGDTVTLHLGRARYGYVKAAVRRSDGAQVVVKFWRRPILQSVSHPNIVPLLDALESRRYYELVMPRHGLGMDLFDLDASPLASYMFRQMAHRPAVAYLHSRGIAHRDLKDEKRRLLRVMLQVDPKLRACICEVERHPWTSQPVNIDCYNFEGRAPQTASSLAMLAPIIGRNSDEAA